MRASRVFRLIVRIFIFLLSLSVTVVSILGGYSAVLILNPKEENISIDTENSQFEGLSDFIYGTGDEINFSLPFNFTNAGYFDLENFHFKLEIALNYSHVDNPNETIETEIFNQRQYFGDIPQGEARSFVFFADETDFLIENFPNATTEINWFRGPPALLFYANFTVSLDYSIGLHSIRIGVQHILIAQFP